MVHMPDMSRYKTVIKFLIIGAVVFGLLLFFFWGRTYPKHVVLNGKVYKIEVADNSALLKKGLSGHKPLLGNEGMLFIFQKAEKYGFWMKDMTFPIDIIWFDQNLKVVHIEKDVSPDSYPKTFTPNSDALYVLELASGQSDIIKLKIGDSLEIIQNSPRNLAF